MVIANVTTDGQALTVANTTNSTVTLLVVRTQITLEYTATAQLPVTVSFATKTRTEARLVNASANQAGKIMTVRPGLDFAILAVMDVTDQPTKTVTNVSLTPTPETHQHASVRTTGPDLTVHTTRVLVVKCATDVTDQETATANTVSSTLLFIQAHLNAPVTHYGTQTGATLLTQFALSSARSVTDSPTLIPALLATKDTTSTQALVISATITVANVAEEIVIPTVQLAMMDGTYLVANVYHVTQNVRLAPQPPINAHPAGAIPNLTPALVQETVCVIWMVMTACAENVILTGKRSASMLAQVDTTLWLTLQVASVKWTLNTNSISKTVYQADGQPATHQHTTLNVVLTSEECTPSFAGTISLPPTMSISLSGFALRALDTSSSTTMKPAHTTLIGITVIIPMITMTFKPRRATSRSSSMSVTKATATTAGTDGSKST